ncbi:MAG: TfoX/Sxy family protein [Candidatus Methanoplasma sp.]|jgi:TfoX/Sxy family transcriptional regulator of competence genes|nr:TfoX/Sxy family protein [Candidatus Methanoplasma sp.]
MAAQLALLNSSAVRSRAGVARHKKMFGNYTVYVNDKTVLLVCDDNVFVKMLPELVGLMKGADTDFPYDGAKEHYVLDIDDTELARAVVAALEIKIGKSMSEKVIDFENLTAG